MTDRYENIRKALVNGLTPGPWGLKDGRTDTVENAQGYPVCTGHWHPDERYGHGTRAALVEPTCKQSLQVAEQQGPEHISSPDCWCEPELDYKDPETGAEVWVHRSMQ